MKNGRFEIGDRVQVVHNTTESAKFIKDGDVVSVIGISEYPPLDTFVKMKSGIVYWLNSKELRLIQNHKFTKSDLRSGDVCVQRDGMVEICVLETGTLVVGGGFNKLCTFTQDLSCTIGHDYDIVKVYRPKTPQHCQFNPFFYELGELVYDRDRDEKPEFDRWKWIDEHFRAFKSCTRVYVTNNLMRGVTIVYRVNGTAVSIAKCSNSDEFDEKTGIAVAYAKLCGEKIPKEI